MPKVSIKSEKQIAAMAEGGKKLGQILTEVLEKVVPGNNTLEIDSWIEDGIINVGGEPSFKTVPRYHWSSCVGLNDEVVHSIPRKEKILKAGDLLKVDLGMLWEALHTDLSWTIMVGGDDPLVGGDVGGEKRKFLAAGEKALEEAIKIAVPGNRVGHISGKIQEIIEGAGYQPVKILTGHGIGKKLHEDPLIPGVLRGRTEDTPELVEGMTIAIEVIYGLGSGDVVLENDGWTVSTKDGKIAGLFEKTIAVTSDGPLILTPLSGDGESRRGNFVC